VGGYFAKQLYLAVWTSWSRTRRILCKLHLLANFYCTFFPYISMLTEITTGTRW